MIKTIYINGRFLSDEISGGVKRFAMELTVALAENNLPHFKFVVLCPPNADIPQNTCRIEYRKIGKFKGNLWEQISLPRFVNRKKTYCLNLCNTFPILCKKNITTFHDLRPIEELKTGKKNCFILKFNYMLRKARKKKMVLFTDSNFSKQRIIELYEYPENLINVVRLGHEHCANNYTVTVNKNGERYNLCVSSVSPHKNFDFIVNLAKKYPNEKFLVIGKKFCELNVEIPDNMKFLGWIDDEQLANYYANATCFIAPSLYEGFGLTPLEAIHYGCQVVYFSDIPVFHEIFGSIGTYFNPYKPEFFSFDDYHVITKQERQQLLNTYSWANCAQDVLNVLCSVLD